MRSSSSAVLVAIAASAVCGQNSVTDSGAMQAYEAHVTSARGQVTRIRDEVPWAVSSGERVAVQQVITTGDDGYAHFEVAGGSSFDVFSNSRVVFRANAASAGDLLDVVAGRVRVHLRPGAEQPQQRVYTPVAIITARQPATIALAIDEDDTLRVDVLEGEVRVQHALLPRTEPAVVRALDAILVQKDQPISRRVDRGSLYRYTVKILSAVTFGHSSSKTGTPVEGKFLAESSRFCPVP